MKNYDLVILGGGAAGFAAATVADGLDANAAMINSGLPLGGTCVNVGCVPTKHLLAVAESLYQAQNPRFDALGIPPPSFDFSRAVADKDRLIETLRGTNYDDVLGVMPRVDLFSGEGRFVSPHEIEVGGERIIGERFLIATGASPRVPSFPGIDTVGYLTNREALSLARLPKSLIVIGAGPLGLEFAQMFSRFGSDVTVLTHGERILSREEPQISSALASYLEEEGIAIHKRVEVNSLRDDNGMKKVGATIDGEKLTFTAEELLVAVGVRANTGSLGLAQAGVEIKENGDILVDDRLQTSADHIYAAGDVIGPPHLETVAAKEGHVAASNALGAGSETIDYNVIPHAVFTSPQVASVGMTEEAYMSVYNVCACRTVEMRYLPKARAINDTRGLVKMTIDPNTTRIVGVHILAPIAVEMIHEALLAVKNEMTVDELIDTVHVFPTFSEAIKMAAQAFRRDITKMSCCVE